MLRGPKGQWRPADPVARAVHIGKLATGRIEETIEAPHDPEADHAAASRHAGIGGEACAKLTPERRRETAKAGAAASLSGGA